MKKIIFDLDGTLINSYDRLYFLFKLLVPECTFSKEEYWNLKRNKMNHKDIIEKYFPSMNVRYIAVMDNVDTFDPNNTNNDITPFKSVFNDMYAKDTSRKVRTVLMSKAINGESIKSFQPYGYKKDPNNKNKILVDTNVSDMVFLIFDMLLNMFFYLLSKSGFLFNFSIITCNSSYVYLILIFTLFLIVFALCANCNELIVSSK